MRLIRWFKRLFHREPPVVLDAKALDYCLSRAIIGQREAMHQAYFEHQPLINWIKKEKARVTETV